MFDSYLNDPTFGYVGLIPDEGVVESPKTVVAEAPRPDDVPSAADQLAAQFYSYHIGMEGVKESTKTHRAILAGDGAYIAKQITVNGNKGAVLTPTDNIPGLPKFGKGSIDIEITNRVPVHILRQLVSDFHAICKLQSTEAAAQVFKDSEGNFEIYYPEQEVSGGSARYSNAQDNAVERWGSKELVLEVHSHNTMGAFFSGTDDANEKRPGIYAVFGQLSSPRCSFVARFRYERIEKRLKLEDVFDLSDTPEELALSTVGLPEPSQTLIERAKRSNPNVRGLDHTGIPRAFPTGVDPFRYGRGLGSFDYREYYARLREEAALSGFDESDDDWLARREAKKRLKKKSKKAAGTSVSLSPLIDALWVVKAMNDPDQIRRMIIALDDKLNALAKKEVKEVSKSE